MELNKVIVDHKVAIQLNKAIADHEVARTTG
jgi:hypothetical protein